MSLNVGDFADVIDSPPPAPFEDGLMKIIHNNASKIMAAITHVLPPRRVRMMSYMLESFVVHGDPAPVGVTPMLSVFMYEFYDEVRAHDTTIKSDPKKLEKVWVTMAETHTVSEVVNEHARVEADAELKAQKQESERKDREDKAETRKKEREDREGERQRKRLKELKIKHGRERGAALGKRKRCAELQSMLETANTAANTAEAKLVVTENKIIEAGGEVPSYEDETEGEPTEGEPTGAEPTEAEPTGSEPTGSEPTGSEAGSSKAVSDASGDSPNFVDFADSKPPKKTTKASVDPSTQKRGSRRKA